MCTVFDLWRLPAEWDSDLRPDFVGELNELDSSLLKQCMEGRAKSVLVEHDYIDKDFRNTFSGFYSKKFARVSNRCLRLHFFDVVVEKEDLRTPGGLAATLEKRVKDEQRSEIPAGTTPGFLGSVVLRPTPYSRIGRCTFDPRKIGSKTPSGHRGEVCLAPFRIHLMGHELKVMAFPHQSQDSQVHTCAETALWSLFRYMSQRYRIYPECYPHDIALLNPDLAYGRRIPSRGLTLQQIAAIIGHFGMDAVMYSKQHVAIDEDAPSSWAYRPPVTKNDGLVRWLHIYLQSGMPAIVGVPGHAIVALGFEEADQAVIDPKPSEPCLTSDFLESIVANDDNRAPYVRVKRQANGILEYGWEAIDSFVVALPSKVFLTAEDAEGLGAGLAEAVAKMIGLDPSAQGRWVRRVLCTSSKNYKNFRLGHPDSFSQLLLGQPLPHFIWLVEYYAHTSWPERRATIEIALDATAAPFEDQPFLWIRFPGGVMMNWERLYGVGSSGLRRPLEGFAATRDAVHNMRPFEPVEVLALDDLAEPFVAFHGNLKPLC